MNRILDQYLKEHIDEVLQEFEKHNVMPNKQAKATFQFLTDISCGKVPTTAHLIRREIRHHKDYKHDSILPEVCSCDSRNSSMNSPPNSWRSKQGKI